MKNALVTISALMVAGSVHAASDQEVYHGWAAGNPDLATDVAGAQVAPGAPEVRFEALVYNGFEQGNPELAYAVETRVGPAATQPGMGDRSESASTGLGRGSIYHGFEVGNPDL